MSKMDKMKEDWELPDIQITRKHWAELTLLQKFRRTGISLTKFLGVLTCLYFFICSLDFMSAAFRLLGAKTAGKVFHESSFISNPIAALMVGILSAALLHSSSMVVSVVIAMVASRIIMVRTAIPIIMGADIGTAITNIIVSIIGGSSGKTKKPKKRKPQKVALGKQNLVNNNTTSSPSEKTNLSLANTMATNNGENEDEEDTFSNQSLNLAEEESVIRSLETFGLDPNYCAFLHHNHINGLEEITVLPGENSQQQQQYPYSNGSSTIKTTLGGSSIISSVGKNGRISALTQQGKEEETEKPKLTGNEFYKRAFAAATVHDMFNWLSVVIFLPLELLTGFLFHTTSAIINSLKIETVNYKQKQMLKALTKPFTSQFIQLDEKALDDIAKSKPGSMNLTILKRWCKNVAKSNTIVGPADHSTVITKQRCRFLFARTNLSDNIVGIILLIFSLCLLGFCLVGMVKILQSILKTRISVSIRHIINYKLPGKLGFLTGYIAILFGAFVTFMIQSSTIFTSTLTPLVGVGLVAVENVYPLALGSNIGTTTTGLIASLTVTGVDIDEDDINYNNLETGHESTNFSSGLSNVTSPYNRTTFVPIQPYNSLKASLQIALIHMFYNIFGVLLFYPLPFMRWPLFIAKFLGDVVYRYRWFSTMYLLGFYFLCPILVFGLSALGGIRLLLGVFIGPVLTIIAFALIVNKLQRCKPKHLPPFLRDWDFLPEYLHSLKPMDRLIKRIMRVFTSSNFRRKKRTKPSGDDGEEEEGGNRKKLLGRFCPSCCCDKTTLENKIKDKYPPNHNNCSLNGTVYDKCMTPTVEGDTQSQKLNSTNAACMQIHPNTAASKVFEIDCGRTSPLMLYKDKLVNQDVMNSVGTSSMASTPHIKTSLKFIPTKFFTSLVHLIRKRLTQKQHEEGEERSQKTSTMPVTVIKINRNSPEGDENKKCPNFSNTESLEKLLNDSQPKDASRTPGNIQSDNNHTNMMRNTASVILETSNRLSDSQEQTQTASSASRLTNLTRGNSINDSGIVLFDDNSNSLLSLNANTAPNVYVSNANSNTTTTDSNENPS